MRCKLGKLHLEIGVPELTLAALMITHKGKDILLSAFLAAALHEGGHLLMMRLLKKNAGSLRITPFGARITYPREQLFSYRQDGLIACAGPAGSFLAALFLLQSPLPIFRRTGAVSLLLGAINLLLAKPLDGERIFRALPAVQRSKKSGSLCRKAAFCSILVALLLTAASISFGVGGASPAVFSAYLLCYAIREDQTD